MDNNIKLLTSTRKIWRDLRIEVQQYNFNTKNNTKIGPF